MEKTPFRRLRNILPHSEKQRKTDEKKKKNGKTTTSAVAAMTAAGVLMGGALSSPTDLMDDGNQTVIQSLDMAAPVIENGGAGTGTGIEAEVEEEKRGVFAKVRRMVRTAPAELRASVAIPLWVLGTVVIAVFSSLWAGALSPIAVVALSWVAFAVLAVLVFTLSVKTAFPDLPIKKILNRRSLLTIVSLCFLFGLADAALPFFWEDYALISKLLKVVGSFACTCAPVAFFLRRHKRKAQEEIVAEVVEETPEPSMEEKEAAARARVMELADSVSNVAR